MPRLPHARVCSTGHLQWSHTCAHRTLGTGWARLLQNPLTRPRLAQRKAEQPAGAGPCGLGRSRAGRAGARWGWGSWGARRREGGGIGCRSLMLDGTLGCRQGEGRGGDAELQKMLQARLGSAVLPVMLQGPGSREGKRGQTPPPGLDAELCPPQQPQPWSFGAPSPSCAAKLSPAAPLGGFQPPSPSLLAGGSPEWTLLWAVGSCGGSTGQ